VVEYVYIDSIVASIIRDDRFAPLPFFLREKIMNRLSTCLSGIRNA